MNPPPSTAHEVQALVHHSQWVRRLAIELVGDPHVADDLAQDACLAALEARPGADRSMKQWLGTVVRNAARQRWRRDSRRLGRERDVARAEATPSVLDLVERVTAHRAVVDAVVALDEPYRATLLLRYFEDLTPGEIARRTSVPIATVKTRLQRGLALLRARLSARAGEARDDGRAWLSALAPLAVTPSPASLLGAFAMSTALKVVSLIVVVVGGFAVAWPEREPEPTTPTTPGIEVADEGVAPPAQLAEVAEESSTRAPAADTTPRATPSGAQSRTSSRPAAPTAARTAFDVTGRVLGPNAEPRSGVALVFVAQDGREVVTSSVEGGRFELKGLTAGGRVTARDERFATVYAGAISARHGDAEPVVVIARRVTLAGLVVDEGGRPIGGAMVRPREPEGFRARFDAVMDYSSDVLGATESAADGSFELVIAALDGGDLLVSHPEYRAWSAPLPPFDDRAMRATLERPALDGRTVTGLVLDPDNRPVPGASVSFGVHGTLTDDLGVFRVALDDPESPNRMARRLGLAPLRILAVKEGFLPGVLELVPAAVDGEPQFPDSIVLRLGGAPLAVEGQVVDAAGAPVAGAEVWARDASVLEFGRGGARTVECVLRGGAENWSSVTTGEDGRFRVEGLMDQPYVIAAHDPNTLLRAEREAAPGGAPVTLVLDMANAWRRVAGRTVDRHGQPVPGVSVAPATDAFFVRYQGRIVSTSHAHASVVDTSDAEGKFELVNVPRELVYLRIDGEDILSDDWGRRAPGGLAALSDGRIEELEVVVRRRVHLQVHLTEPAEADALRILDEAGEPITIDLIQAGGRRSMPEMPLVGGRSDVLSVHDGATTLVLVRQGEEVRRATLALQASGVNRVDL